MPMIIPLVDHSGTAPRTGPTGLTEMMALDFLRLVMAGVADNAPLQRQVFEYIMLPDPDVELDDLMDGSSKAGADEMKGLVGTIAETQEARVGAEGEARGTVRGRVEGLAEGEVNCPPS